MCEQTADSPRFKRIAAGLPVEDMPTAKAFYLDRLGFHQTYSNADYAVLHRDDVSIHLSVADEPGRAGTGFCTIFVTGVDAVYSACVESGVTIKRPLEQSPYGMRDFVLLDPAGNSLLIGEPENG